MAAFARAKRDYVRAARPIRANAPSN